MDKKETLHEKNELLKKVGKYSVAAGAALLTGNMANAAVQAATSGVPFTIDYNQHGIDFDGDGLFEVFVNGDARFSSWSSSSSWFSYSGNWAYLESGSDPDAAYFEVIQHGVYANDSYDPAALPLNHLIGPTLSGTSYWSNSFYATLMSTGSGIYNNNDGNFDMYPNETRYVGIRFSSDETNWHYGWIAVQANPLPYSSGNFGQVINYAYETEVNKPILAGNSVTVPLLPIASAAGLGLVGLFGALRARRKKQTV
ncbi:MAG: hypothetical protein GXX78_05230 [Bacteroidales bacterium]|nr:hypothetical protein [Bacteroidales bacterium]